MEKDLALAEAQSLLEQAREDLGGAQREASLAMTYKKEVDDLSVYLQEYQAKANSKVGHALSCWVVVVLICAIFVVMLVCGVPLIRNMCVWFSSFSNSVRLCYCDIVAQPILCRWRCCNRTSPRQRRRSSILTPSSCAC